LAQFAGSPAGAMPQVLFGGGNPAVDPFPEPGGDPPLCPPLGTGGRIAEAGSGGPRHVGGQRLQSARHTLGPVVPEYPFPPSHPRTSCAAAGRSLLCGTPFHHGTDRTEPPSGIDRKSTRLNSSHVKI